MLALDAPQELQSGEAGHGEIAQDQVRGLPIEDPEGLFGVLAALHVRLILEHLPGELPVKAAVVDHEHASTTRRLGQLIPRLERRPAPWADGPLPWGATEELLLPDGRLLLWRRYNGAWWSRRNPAQDGKDGRTFEALADAGVPELRVFGESYRLFYDQLPDYARPSHEGVRKAGSDYAGS